VVTHGAGSQDSVESEAVPVGGGQVPRRAATVIPGAQVHVVVGQGLVS